MEEIIGKISFVRFIWITVICLSLFFLYNYIQKVISRQLKASGKSQRFLRLLSIINRILVIVICVIILVSFILTNPLVNLTIIAFLTFFGYDTFRNFILGTVLQQEFDLTEGRSYNVGNYHGILVRKGWTGLKLSSQGNLAFIPYKLAYSMGITAEQRTSSSTVLLEMNLPDDYSEKQIIRHIKSLLFPLPYIIEGNIPKVEVVDNTLMIEVGLINSSYILSLQDHLSSHSYKTHILEK